MNDATLPDELTQLKRELSKLKLEANLRKSLSAQLEAQKKIADQAKEEALKKSGELEEVSHKLAKYLSPQIHEQIFSGKQSAEITSYRKKLTVFFSDIVGFTRISDELESEEITSLINFYLNEMSKIALKYGGTIDKFIGDSIMIFFGDPTSKGTEEDAKLCVDMAIEMVARMDELKGTWGKKFGLRNDLEIRIGINTGYCTVGNFGSDERLDYTAVGGTVNLASRLESLAESGSICISEDTHLLIGSHFKFAEEKEIDVKGYLRKIRYYQLDRDLSKNSNDVLQMKGNGFNISIDKGKIADEDYLKIRETLEQFAKE
jgi:adenylate cyclase